MAVALVTGGTTGIGAAIAEELAAAHFTVAASYGHDDATAEAFAARTGIRTFHWDVADDAQCADGVRQVEAALGPIDVLVNNAGITADAMLHKMQPDAWRRVLGTNLDGCFYMCRAVVPGMRARARGRIVNISSVNAQTGQLGQTNYAASKAGLIGLSKSLARENAAFNITVNVVAPGYTDTAMTRAVPAAILEKIVAGIPLKRMAKPVEIAKAVAYLVSDDAGYITGCTLPVNGGLFMN